MKPFQIRKQVKLQGHIAGSDPDLSLGQILHLLKLPLSQQNIFVSTLNIGIKQLSLHRQPDALGGPHKQCTAQILFQIFYRLADRGLGNCKRLRSLCDALVFSHIIKNLVVFQIYIHSFLSLIFFLPFILCYLP